MGLDKLLENASVYCLSWRNTNAGKQITLKFKWKRHDGYVFFLDGCRGVLTGLCFASVLQL